MGSGKIKKGVFNIGYSDTYARTMQMARLSTVLICSFDIAQLITLRFRNLALPERVKKNDVRALLARAKVRAGDSLRYVIVPEYGAENDGVIAYHVITDMPADVCADVCKRWSSGEFEISPVDIKQRETLPPFMFNPSSVRRGRRFYSTSHNISC